ncbi:MAG: hypothetical protein KDI79_02070 [Anaerolineae bacterium]|nr:hypothetical protein [Anaerolineae bacterium]
MRLIFKHSNKIIFLLSVVMWLTSSVVFAQEEANIYLQSAETPEGRVKVDIMAENVTDLYGAEIKLRYDPTILAVQDADPGRDGLQITEGEFLPASKGFVVANQVDDQAGTITYALTLLNPTPPVNGSGIIATITFESRQDTPTTIEIEKAKLVASTLQSIPNQTASLEIGGQTPVEIATITDDATLSTEMANTAPASSNEIHMTRWLAAAGVIGMIALGLGLLLLLGSVVLFGRRPAKPKKPASTGKSGPTIWLRPVSNIRIQRPRLSPSRRAAQTRANNK